MRISRVYRKIRNHSSKKSSISLEKGNPGMYEGHIILGLRCTAFLVTHGE